MPNRAHGYCTDDNARALLLTTRPAAHAQLPGGRDLQSIYAAFLHEAFNPERGRFRNFMSYDRRWLEEVGSEDSHGRACWALGTVAGGDSNASLRTWAAETFNRAIPATHAFTSPRAWAFTILGLHAYLRRFGDDIHARDACVELSQRLVSYYEDCASSDWPWIEDVVAYDNPRICQALLMTSAATECGCMREIGLCSLAWLMEHQTNDMGLFRPVGSDELWRRGGRPAPFDQQPIEAWAAVDACIEAYRVTKDRRWATEACRAFDWFVGGNDLNLSIYDATTGGCRDGLHVDRVNANQGAESTLAFLLALAEMNDSGVYCSHLGHR